MKDNTASTASSSAHSFEGIPVSAQPGVDLAVALAAKPFLDWFAKVDRESFNIRSIDFQSLDMFGPRVGFIKFKCDVVDSSGRFLPGIIFARGGSVAVLAMLECEGEHHAVLTVQPRLATGDFDFAELCAGMLDGSGDFAGVAAKELKEELGIELGAGDLTDLSSLAGYPGGVYLSPGACEETIRFFAFCKSVSKEELADINGRCTGALDEGEQITLKLVPLAELDSYPDAKTIVALALLRRFASKIPGFENKEQNS